MSSPSGDGEGGREGGIALVDSLTEEERLKFKRRPNVFRVPDGPDGQNLQVWQSEY
jgi:hypothetical protein